MEKKKIRVLYIASSDAGTGGSGKSLCEMVTLLKKEHRVEPVVINTNYNDLNRILSQAGIENYSAGYKMNICQEESSKIKTIIKYFVKYLIYCFSIPYALLKINKCVDLKTIDVIHINNSTQDIGAMLGKKYKIPVVWHLREFGEKDFNFLYFKSCMAQYISMYSSKVIAISDVIKNDWVEKGVDSKKIVTIMHGINPDGIEMANHENEKVRIVFAGRIVKPKGQEAFIDALAQLPEKTKHLISVDFLGSGDRKYLSFLEEKVRKLNLEQVVNFKGYINNIKEKLPQYDIGVVNSKSEGMGRVTIEYMTAGLCVLASNRGANIEIIDDGQTGYLYDFEDVGSLVHIIELLCKDRQKIFMIGKNARQKALLQYSIKKNARKYREIYEEIILEKYKNA